MNELKLLSDRDEPTVGIDPVMREVIWALLEEIVLTNDQTVLITTHCWSEATRATTVGFMRNGRLLVENSPSQLMSNFATHDIEEVFYQLCTENERNVEFAISSGHKQLPIEAEGNDKDVFDWHAFKALLLKDSIHAKRHAGFLGFQVVLPIFVTLLFYACIGRTMYCLA